MRELIEALERISAMCPVTCDMSLAHEMADIADAALAAAKAEAVEPVAWMYAHPNDPLPPSVRTCRHEASDFYAMSKRGWTETPLYPAPQRTAAQERADVVTWLRDGGQLRDFNGIIANAIERGEHERTTQ